MCVLLLSENQHEERETDTERDRQRQTETKTARETENTNTNVLMNRPSARVIVVVGDGVGNNCSSIIINQWNNI